MPAYWILVIFFACHVVIGGGLTVYCIPFLTENKGSVTLHANRLG